MAQAITLTSFSPQQLEESCKLLCIYGHIDSSLASSLQKWLQQTDDRYLIIIEDQEPLFLQAKYSSLAQEKKVRLFFYQQETKEALFNQIAWEFLGVQFTYISLAQEKAEKVFRQLEVFRQAVHLLAADAGDGGLKVLKNILNNLKNGKRSLLASCLKNSCCGIPAIICGASPSLNQVLPFLHRLQDKALLIAGGTAVNILTSDNLLPHVSAYVDPSPPHDRFAAHTAFETPFFYPLRFSSSLFLRAHGMPIWIWGTGNYPIEQWLTSLCDLPRGEVDSGWTVANMAVLVALHLGCNPLILCGMDFCATEKEVYAGGVSGEENRAQLISYQDETGKCFQTKPDWLLSAQWIAEKVASHPEKTWINLSQGLSIQGAIKKPIEEVVDCFFPVSYDLEGHLFSYLSQATSFKVSPSQGQKVASLLEESFISCLKACDHLLDLWQNSFPVCPSAQPEYILAETQLESENAFRHFLDPLWALWRPSILRQEEQEFAKQLHRLLFFKQSLEKIKKAFPL